jgi:dTDP-4-amino-4,6-dideoxygalactose transaminase
MVVTQDAEFAEKVRLLRVHGSPRKYHHVFRGRNSRLDALQAVILGVKLKYLEEWNKKRRAHAAVYQELLAGLPLALPVEKPGNHHIYHQYTIRVKKRDEVRHHLDEAGVKTAVHYPLCMHQQPAFAELGYGDGDFPVCERASREVLSLPMFPELGRDQIERVAQALAQATKALGLEGEGPPEG